MFKFLLKKVKRRLIIEVSIGRNLESGEQKSKDESQNKPEDKGRDNTELALKIIFVLVLVLAARFAPEMVQALLDILTK